MRLIDFKAPSSKLSKLVSKIGANYPNIDFSSTWNALDIGALDIALNNEGIDIDAKDLEVNPIDDTFMYEGRRVLVYIRDQRGSYINGQLTVSDYRFHIINCKTIMEFRRKGKFNRYVVSTRTDNLFSCNILIGQDVQQQFRELKVCKNCLDQLCYLRYCNLTSNQKEEIHVSFNLVDYFKKYNGTYVSKPKFNDRDQPVGIYPENWPEISRRIRIRFNWKCQNCLGDFSNRKSFLDTHHIDSNPGNCEESNLIPLCKTCHKQVHLL